MRKRLVTDVAHGVVRACPRGKSAHESATLVIMFFEFECGAGPRPAAASQAASEKTCGAESPAQAGGLPHKISYILDDSENRVT